MSSGRGMRKMLKNYKLPAHKYMALSKQTGIFPNKFDQEMYEIITHNPPMPTPPMPTYESMKDFDIRLPTDKYVHAYMRRHNMHQSGSRSRRRDYEMTDLLSEFIMKSSTNEEASRSKTVRDLRYKKILGPAYDFAVRQYEMLKEHPEMTEEESVESVEILLEKEDRKERFHAKQKRDEVLKKAKASTMYSDGDIAGSAPSMLFGNAKAAETMAQFGDYLKNVPYYRWTVGAATALDHWIAIEILELSEKTWQEILQGEAFSQASDVIAVRTTLFPETLDEPDDFDDTKPDDFNDKITDDTENELSDDEERDAAIEGFLASLESNGDDTWTDDLDKEVTKGDAYEFDESEVQYAKLKVMEKEIEIWQRKNMQNPFQMWSDTEKQEFEEWLKEYATLLPPLDSGNEIDTNQVKKDVLYNVYIPKEESDALWAALADPTESEMILSQLRESHEKKTYNAREGESEDERLQREEYKAFMKLPYNEQLEHLRELGCLRPLFDESVSNDERVQFLSDNEEVLLEGIEETSLEPSRNGNIRDTDIGLSKRGMRYQLRKIVHGQYGAETTASAKVIAQERALYKVWGQYRQMKANHEEFLFRQGLLGLKYENREDALKPTKPPQKGDDCAGTLPWKW